MYPFYLDADLRRLKLRESAADVADVMQPSPALSEPPQAPRIRCGCRPYEGLSQKPRCTASSSENPLRMSRQPSGEPPFTRPASSSENPLRMSPGWNRYSGTGSGRLKLRESAADVAGDRRRERDAAGPPQAPRIRCGCRATCGAPGTARCTASSSENPLRMSQRMRVRPSAVVFRLKLRESAADVARVYSPLAPPLRPPQAPRIRCGCRPHSVMR